MALIKCPECGKEISDKAQTCIHCGYPLSEAITCGEVWIKIPNNIAGGVVGFFSSKRAAVKDQCGQILWEGNCKPTTENIIDTGKKGCREEPGQDVTSGEATEGTARTVRA